MNHKIQQNWSESEQDKLIDQCGKPAASEKTKTQTTTYDSSVWAIA